MTHRKSAEEMADAFIQEMLTKRYMPVQSERSAFISGYNEGVRAAIEELRSKDAFLIQIEPIGETAGAMKAETGFKWADWLEKRMGEKGESE